MLVPLQLAGGQQEGLPEEEQHVQLVWAEPVPLGLHHEAGRTEQPLHGRTGGWWSQVPGEECTRFA